MNHTKAYRKPARLPVIVWHRQASVMDSLRHYGEQMAALSSLMEEPGFPEEGRNLVRQWIDHYRQVCGDGEGLSEEQRSKFSAWLCSGQSDAEWNMIRKIIGQISIPRSDNTRGSL